MLQHVPELFIDEQQSIVHICHVLFTHSFVEGHLDCFYLLVIVNNAVRNIDVQESFRDPIFNYVGYIPRSRTAGSYNNAMFSFLRNHHSVIHRDYTILYSLQQYMAVPTCSHPCQPLLCMYICVHIYVYAHIYIHIDICIIQFQTYILKICIF